MKITYLVFENGIGSALRVATKEEWKKIMENNRGAETSRRRYFIKDCFEDGGSLDCLFYEASKADFDKWHAENQRQYRKRASSGSAEILSLDISVQTSDGSCMLDIMTDGIDWEKKMIDDLLMKDLRVQLAAWRDWANELLDYYLSGQKKEATRILSEKYGVSQKTIRLRKRSLDEFLLNFLK